LLISAIGAAGLSASVGAVVGTAASLTAGAALSSYSKEKDLAKEVSFFKSSLKEIEKEMANKQKDNNDKDKPSPPH
jgi:phosphoenolpyruvate-protein kinase (PTS system EI component)